LRQDELKRQAAERAVELVEDGMVLGLGTGSTARFALEALAERRQRGELADIVGIPTSVATQQAAELLGVPLTTLEDHPHIDLTLDGADEVDPSLDLIKGLGGALLWEKIVASASGRLVILVDETKLVDRLGRKAPLPVEVVPFGWATHAEAARALGAEPTLRTRNGQPFRTDGGHYIVDCRFPDGIADPRAVEETLRARVGVVETGLFLGLATTVVVGTDDGPRIMEREG
jgi:ribose 5-phosphate isomerase A